MPESKRPLKVFPSAAQGKPLPYHPLVGRLRGQAEGAELYRAPCPERVEGLKRRGAQPWLDAEDLIPGQNWKSAGLCANNPHWKVGII